MLFSLGFFLYLVASQLPLIVRSFFLCIRHSPVISISPHPSHCRPSRCFSFSPLLIHLLYLLKTISFYSAYSHSSTNYLSRPATLTRLLTPAPETSPAYRKPSHATVSSFVRSNGAHPRTIPIQSTTRSLDAHIDRTSIFCLRLHPPEREGAAHPRPCTVIPACLRTQRTSRATGTPLLPAGASSRIFRTCYCGRPLHLAQQPYPLRVSLSNLNLHAKSLPRAATHHTQLASARDAHCTSALAVALCKPYASYAHRTRDPDKTRAQIAVYVARFTRPGNCQGTDGQCR
jgi:hypothetical protein